MKLSQAAEEVIGLAKAIQNYWDAELPKRHPDYPFVHAGEESGPPPPEEKELKQLLTRLPPDIVYKLILVMYLGRGDFGANELAGQYKAVRKAFAKPANAASQMLQKVPLADYLAEGLLELQKSGVDPDNLALTSVKAAGPAQPA